MICGIEGYGLGKEINGLVVIFSGKGFVSKIFQGVRLDHLV